MNPGGVRSGRRPRFSISEAAGYGVIAAAVWLGWEVVKSPVAQRAPPSLAIRLAPASPDVLRRASEAEMLAGRTENASALASDSLARAPFNAAALRLRGLAEAKLGSSDRADEMLTLAGNWSLRDDPAHAWLIEHRLRRGDYSSAFAHADTLARRRPDLHPALFRLFTSAASQDPRALPALTRLLKARPPWRRAYLAHLYEDESGASVVGALAMALERTDGRFNVSELQQLYDTWLGERRFAGLRQIREQLGRPQSEPPLQNGAFDTEPDLQIYPFGWRMGADPGIATAMVVDDLNAGNRALRLEYNGFSSGAFIEQLLLLEPGEYVLQGQWRAETPRADMRLDWRISCAETGAESVISRPGTFSAKDGRWRRFAVRFVVPRENCSAQWLRLTANPRDHRVAIVAWFDQLAIRGGT